MTEQSRAGADPEPSNAEVVAAVVEALGDDAPQMDSLWIRRAGYRTFVYRLHDTEGSDYEGGVLTLD